MMRITLLLLVLANAGYYAWSQGHLMPLGGANSWANPQPRREPQRTAQQLHPERLTLARQVSDTATPAPPPEPPPTVVAYAPCQESVGLSDSQWADIQTAVSTALPAGSWLTETTEPAPRSAHKNGRKRDGSDSRPEVRQHTLRLHQTTYTQLNGFLDLLETTPVTPPLIWQACAE